MNTEDKIKELLNECPINKAHLTEDELSAYHQGLRCGAYNMAEWKDKQFKEEKKQWIEKAVEWIENNIIGMMDGDLPYIQSTYDVSKNEFIEDFKQAVKVE